MTEISVGQQELFAGDWIPYYAEEPGPVEATEAYQIYKNFGNFRISWKICFQFGKSARSRSGERSVPSAVECFPHSSHFRVSRVWAPEITSLQI